MACSREGRKECRGPALRSALLHTSGDTVTHKYLRTKEKKWPTVHNAGSHSNGNPRDTQVLQARMKFKTALGLADTWELRTFNLHFDLETHGEMLGQISLWIDKKRKKVVMLGIKNNQKKINLKISIYNLSVSIKIKMYISHDPTVLLPEIHATAIRAQIHRDICIKMYTTGSFLMAKIRNILNAHWKGNNYGSSYNEIQKNE